MKKGSAPCKTALKLFPLRWCFSLEIWNKLKWKKMFDIRIIYHELSFIIYQVVYDRHILKSAKTEKLPLCFYEVKWLISLKPAGTPGSIVLRQSVIRGILPSETKFVCILPPQASQTSELVNNWADLRFEIFSCLFRMTWYRLLGQCSSTWIQKSSLIAVTRWSQYGDSD